MLTLAVLGPVDLRRDGVALPVPGGKTAELLVRLALEAGTPVRAERLLEDLWPGSRWVRPRTPCSPRCPGCARRWATARSVTEGDAGYTLALTPGDVDALPVLRLARRRRPCVARVTPSG